METKFSSLLPIKLVLKNVASIKEQMGFLIWTPELDWTPSCYRIFWAGAGFPKWEEAPVEGQSRQSPVLSGPPHEKGEGRTMCSWVFPDHQPGDWRVDGGWGECY